MARNHDPILDYAKAAERPARSLPTSCWKRGRGSRPRRRSRTPLPSAAWRWTAFRRTARLGAYHRVDQQPDGAPIPAAEVARESAAAIEKWSEDYLMRLMDLAAALGSRSCRCSGARLLDGNWRRASVGFLEGRRLRSARGGPGAVCQEDKALRARASELGLFSPRNPPRHRRDVRG